MQISGKCRIANQWSDGQVDKGAFEFENKGNLGKGRLCWTDVSKGKNGAKDTFVTSNKKFICFKENIAFIEANLGEQLEINGLLKGEQFKGQDDKIVKYELVIINEVKLAEKKAAPFKVKDFFEEEGEDVIPF